MCPFVHVLSFLSFVHKTDWHNVLASCLVVGSTNIAGGAVAALVQVYVEDLDSYNLGYKRRCVNVKFLIVY